MTRDHLIRFTLAMLVMTALNVTLSLVLHQSLTDTFLIWGLAWTLNVGGSEIYARCAGRRF